MPVIGITGPPGAGKSTLLNALTGYLLDQGKKVGLILVDPSSPFNFGALLGDRLRLGHYFTHPNVFIRSVATRGSLGGLTDTILEVTEVMRSFPFDVLFIETVGVGQSEVEIAALADTTIVTLVPEAGDSIQAMKAGLMEIADLFVINKADRPGAEKLANALQLQLQLHHKNEVAVLQTVALEAKGIAELWEHILSNNIEQHRERKLQLLTEKCLQSVRKKRMRSFDVSSMRNQLKLQMQQPHFSLFQFLKNYD